MKWRLFPSRPETMSSLGLLAGIGALYAVALAIDLTRYTVESAFATAAGSVIGASIFPWLAWIYMRRRRHPNPPPSFAAYFLGGTAICLVLIYVSNLSR
jgi:hypothetical protein